MINELSNYNDHILNDLDDDVDEDNDDVEKNKKRVEIQQIKNLKVHLQTDKKQLKKNTNVYFAPDNLHIIKTN